MSTQNSVQNYRPGVDRPAKTYEEVYQEMQQQKQQKSAGIRSKVTGALRVASRLSSHSLFMDDSSENTKESSQMEYPTQEQGYNMSGIYVPNNLMEMRQNVDYMRQNGQKVKTLGYTDAQIGTMSDLDKQKVLSSGFAVNPNGHNAQEFLAKSAAYNITEKMMPQTPVTKPIIKKIKQLAEKPMTSYMDENTYGGLYDNTDYGLVSNEMDYMNPQAESDVQGPTMAPDPSVTMSQMPTMGMGDGQQQPQSSGYDRNAALDALTANIQQRQPENGYDYTSSYF